MKLTIPVGTTSKRLAIFIQSSIAGDGSGLTGLLFSASGLTGYYWREDAGNVAGTSITLATATKGTFSSGGLIEKDSTNMPGWYEFSIPDAALASGAKWVVVHLQGALNMVPLAIEIQLSTPSIAKNIGITGFQFFLQDSTGAAKTGATVAANRSIDGAAFASCANSVSEISNGWYQLNLAASDLNGTAIALRFSATGALDTTITLITQS